MIREVFGNSIQLCACDFRDSGIYKNFFDFSQVEYTELTDPIKLPYKDQVFDVVIASGVLEHSAMDYESLKELHRVIKDGGHIIITFLPNRGSFTEFISRIIGRGNHLRTYGLKDTDRMLRHYGFIPSYANYRQFIPSQRGQVLFKYLWPFNSILEKFWPTKIFCANLMFVAKRCSYL